MSTTCLSAASSSLFVLALATFLPNTESTVITVSVASPAVLT